MLTTLGATGGAQRRGWSVNAGDSAAVQHFRFYLDPVSVVGTVSPLRGMNLTSSGQRFRVQVTSAGVLTLQNNANTTIWTSSALSTGTQWRVEVSVGGSTSATGRVRIYAGDATSTSQDSGDLAGQNFGGPIREVWFGQTAAATNVALTLDDCGWSDTALLGPAPPPPGTGGLTASLPALASSVGGSSRASTVLGASLPHLGVTASGRAQTTGAMPTRLPSLTVVASAAVSATGLVSPVAPPLLVSLGGTSRSGAALTVGLPALVSALAGAVEGGATVDRPFLGVVVRPAAGVTVRPSEGRVPRLADAVVPRPAEGVVLRP
ncbi:hypothetical protein ACWER9_06495 [Micromonospora sp. NPDC003944]